MASALVTWVEVAIFIISSTKAQYFGNYYCSPGTDVVVHLMDWKYSDIQNECPWLAAQGYCAIQISPPQEAIIITNTCPWWTRYQPVSYQLISRGGDAMQLASMVTACNNVGVGIIVDAVINHMAGGSGYGTAGSYWNSGNGSPSNYGGQNYSEVPYGQDDFNPSGCCDHLCDSQDMSIRDYQNSNEVRSCRLEGLPDLSMQKSNVRIIIIQYMNYLLSIGVLGFRVDAVKHMYPADLQYIYSKLNNLTTIWFPPGTRPYIYQEVIYYGSEPITPSDYTPLGRVTEFKYGRSLSQVFMKINNQQLKYLQNFGEGWAFMSRFSALVFVDNHDTQRHDNQVLNYQNPRLYKMAVAFMLAWDYGHPQVMSSFQFSNPDQGPPSSPDGQCHTQNVVCQFNGGAWVCEHRWRQIANMVRFHQVAIGQLTSNWWDNWGNAIAFSRGNKAFIAINNENYPITRTFQTGLPAGTYCNVYLCDQVMGPTCSGDTNCGTVTVDQYGNAYITINNDENPVVAIHV